MGALLRSVLRRVMAGLRRPPILIASLIAVLLFAVLIYSHLFGPTQEFAKTEQFIVTPGTTLAEVAADLRTQGFVQSTLLARMVLSSGADEKGIRAGGYAIGKHMDLWTISKTLSAMPRLVFVSIPPSVRKEEIGAILAQELFWGDEELALWEAATVTDPDMLEGVYYPDTYLIPTDQAPVAIAARLRGRFADVFAPYAAEAKEKGLSWKEVLTLASLVDREAGRDDKELVAGILWNRLELGMRLQVDATLQYIRGTEGKWWPVPRSEDKYLNSPFNTYKHAGLPPHPINNPSVASVAAVLNAQSTDCVFYLHDPDGQIHCSLTYSGQQENVDRYLR